MSIAKNLSSIYRFEESKGKCHMGTTEIGAAWRGDWQVRLRQALSERGFQTLTEYADAHPDLRFDEIAKEFGGTTIAPIQVVWQLRHESTTLELLHKFARSGLVRYLRQYLPMGWTHGGIRDIDTIRVYGPWVTSVPADYEPDCRAVFDRLQELNPPDSWLPNDHFDPLIVEAFGDRFPLDDS